MAIKLKAKADAMSSNRDKPEWNDTSFDQREITVDGYTFHWGPNQTRSFADDGVGAAHAIFKNGTDLCTNDLSPFNDILS